MEAHHYIISDSYSYSIEVDFRFKILGIFPVQDEKGHFT